MGYKPGDVSLYLRAGNGIIDLVKKITTDDFKEETTMSNRIMLNQTSYHGAGAVREIPGEVKARGFKKALVVCGPSILKHGVVANVTDQLDA